LRTQLGQHLLAPIAVSAASALNTTVLISSATFLLAIISHHLMRRDPVAGLAYEGKSNA
jgi:hypothetical protein